MFWLTFFSLYLQFPTLFGLGMGTQWSEWCFPVPDIRSFSVLDNRKFLRKKCFMLNFKYFIEIHLRCKHVKLSSVVCFINNFSFLYGVGRTLELSLSTTRWAGYLCARVDDKSALLVSWALNSWPWRQPMSASSNETFSEWLAGWQLYIHRVSEKNTPSYYWL